MSIDEIIAYRKAQQEETELLERMFEEQSKYNRLARQAEEEVEKAIYKERHRLRIQLGKISNPKIKEAMDEVNSLREELYKKKEPLNNKFSVYWITISPPPVVPLITFKKVVEKAFSKNWIDQYIYVYEQRGITEDECGIKPHIHALLWKGTKKYNQMMREFKSTFSCIIDMEHEYLDNFFQIVGCSERDINKRIVYMLGTKESTDANHKDLKQLYDKPFRERNGLLPYYQKNSMELIESIKI